MEGKNIIDKATFEKAFEYYSKQEPGYVDQVYKEKRRISLVGDLLSSDEVSGKIDKHFDKYDEVFKKLA